jgi:hypothetical protein
VTVTGIFDCDTHCYEPRDFANLLTALDDGTQHPIMRGNADAMFAR